MIKHRFFRMFAAVTLVVAMALALALSSYAPLSQSSAEAAGPAKNAAKQGKAKESGGPNTFWD